MSDPRPRLLAAESLPLARVSALLGEVERAGHELTPEQLAEALGMLARLEALFSIRLNGSAQGAAEEPDRLLTAEEAAERLGIAADTLYRKAKRFPFTVRLGYQVRFSAAGLERFIRARQGKP
jgi:excisionase family DNA binding protein